MKTYFLLLITLLLPLSSHGKNLEYWTFNKDHSEINFSVKFLKISNLSGRFLKYSGRVGFGNDKDTPQQVELDIQSKSVFTGQPIRDGHLKKKDFFHSSKFPYISFKSYEILKKNQSYLAKGILTIKGIEKKVIVYFTLSKMKKDTWEFQNRFVNFKTEINRKDFNITWNKTLDGNELLIDDKIKISGVIQIQPEGMKTPSSKHMIPDNKSIRKREKIARGEIKTTVLLTTPAKLDKKIKLDTISESDKPIMITKKYDVTSSEKERGLSQLLSLLFLGFLSLFSSIYLSIKFKIWLSDKMGPDFKELSFVGITSDMLCMIFVYLFAISFYNLGWGNL